MTTGVIGGRIADPEGQFIANTRVELVAACLAIPLSECEDGRH